MYKIYKGDEVVVEGESPLKITGINPNTEVKKGEFQAVKVEGDRESARVDIPTFKTLPIEVTSVSVSPKTNNLEVGATRQLSAKVEPSAADQTVGWATSNRSIVAVDQNGLIEAIAPGSARIEVTAGDKVDSATVNVTEPEPDPAPEEGE